MAEALIALGGNLDDPPLVMRRALQLLARHPEVRVSHVAPYYRTAPVGADAGEAFFNSAASLETSLNPECLLALLLSVEDHLGRVRGVHWGPRLIDLDLIAMEQRVISSASLTLPHPAMWLRRFVLDPLCDIAPQWQHPRLQLTAKQLLQQLQQRPVRIAAQLDTSDRQRLLEGIQQRFESGAVELVEARQMHLATFCPAPEVAAVKDVALPGLDKVEYALQVLQGILDAPMRIQVLN